MPHNEAHTAAGASMKAQHNTLQNVMEAGKGWILAQQLRKANWVMNQNEQWKEHQQWHK